MNDQVVYRVYDAVAMKSSPYYFATFKEAEQKALELTNKHRFVGTLERFSIIADVIKCL